MANQPPIYWISYGVGLLGASLVVGILAGLLPFFLGRRHGQKRVAVAGLICSIVAGLIGGIIGALPVALIFVVVIFVRRRQSTKPVLDAEPSSDA